VAHGLSGLPARVTLRPISSSDHDFLLQLYASTRDEELAQVPWSDGEREAFLRHQFDAQDRHYREHYRAASFDILELDDVPIGRLYVARWADEIRIMELSLLPEHRGAGIGTRLVRSILDEAAREGKRTSVHVEQRNPARRLYERLGFVPVADRGVYVLMEAEPVTALPRVTDHPKTAS
jgi:GNAT superfamily N-acetyltransferase